MSVSGILFDLDNTLHDRDAGLLSFVGAQHARLELEAQGVALDDWTARFIDLDNKGRVWKDVGYIQLCKEFELSLSPQSLLEEYEACFFGHVRPNAGLHEMLEGLRRSGWRIGVITNGRPVFQRRTIAALNIESFLDSVIVSGECGLRKPDPAIFHLALNELGCLPEESWFVGDDPIADVEGAKAVGMRAMLFDPCGVVASKGPAIVVNSLRQVFTVANGN